jgi:anthranilate phosphoribosyltransferase
MVLRHLIRALGTDAREARNLTREEAARAFSSILGGGESHVTIGSFLTSMRWKGVTVEELTGFAQAARAQARIPCQGMTGLVTLCPSHDGQDFHPPLEVAAGLIAAGAGARVLILSDRCVPPRRGLTAASVLEALGVSMTWDPTEAEDWLEKGRFAVLSISGMLPALLPLRRVRGDVVVRTPLSTVEKLLAPPGSAVVLGAQSGPVLGVAVEVIQALGHPRGIALQGLDGGVVPSVRRRTRGTELSDDFLVPLTVEPADFGLESTVEPELPMFGPPDEGYGTADNPALVKAAGAATRAVLDGEHGPARQAALLGAAVALKASGRCLTLAEGVDAAVAAVESGAANGVLERLRGLIG